jgi:ABC-type multidrug transport system permease subunit
MLGGWAMLIFVAGLFGVVALPFLILLVPLILWLAVPTAVLFGAGLALKALTHRRQAPLLLPLQHS